MKIYLLWKTFQPFSDFFNRIWKQIGSMSNNNHFSFYWNNSSVLLCVNTHFILFPYICSINLSIFIHTVKYNKCDDDESGSNKNNNWKFINNYVLNDGKNCCFMLSDDYRNSWYCVELKVHLTFKIKTKLSWPVLPIVLMNIYMCNALYTALIFNG